MNIHKWALLSGALIFGLVFGCLWSPRSRTPSAEELAAANSRQAKKSQQLSSENSSDNPNSTLSKGIPRKSLAQRELTIENLILAFSGVETEDEINPMEFARYGGQLAQMNERQVTTLLKELQGPFEEEHEDMAGVAQSFATIVFARLCELNGPDAMRMLASGELDTSNTSEVATLGMNAWVAADPGSARRWFEKAMHETDGIYLSGGEDDDLEGAALLISKSDITGAYLRGMSTLNPQAVDDLFASVQNEHVRYLLQNRLAGHVVHRAESKNEILSLLHGESLKDFGPAHVDLIENLVKVDPNEAKTWATAQPLSRDRDDMYSNIATELIKQEPAEGAAWYQAQELSPNTNEGQRLGNITRTWMNQDIEGAATWLLEQPNNAERDMAEAALAFHTVRTGDWESVFQWNADISTTTARQNNLNRILRQTWDPRKRAFKSGALEAARAAGNNEAIDAFVRSKGISAASSNESRLGGSRLSGE